jgi:GT2 family glycosyltransferase
MATKNLESSHPGRIDIIIPIFKGIESTRKCLASVYKYSGDNNRVILINDYSPEGGMVKMLESFRKDDNTIIVNNGENLGYIRSVNKGIALSKNDVILLNSDTIVTRGWVDRMIKIAQLDENTATVTPFSNSGGSVSYPINYQLNDLPKYYTVAGLGAIFSLVGVKKIEIFCGVGFCMYISRKALNEVGNFDEKLFKKGYGEEVDFCYRARQLGYKNLLAPNVFIYHENAVSFGRIEKKKMVEAALKRIMAKYPNFVTDESYYHNNDPARGVRLLLNVMIQIFTPVMVVCAVFRRLNE